ncbi:MAG: hypothetical protein WD872_06270 [Pirellulaceae bacterium]
MSSAKKPTPAGPANPIPPQARRGLGGKLLVLLFGAGLLASIAVGGAFWMIGGAGSAAGEAAAAGSPTVPQPTGPPPAFHPVLAAAPNRGEAEPAAALEAQFSGLPALAAPLQPKFAETSFTGAASSDLIVPAGGKPIDVAQPDAPRHERWQIHFPAGNSLETYIRQMEFFKIELGLIGGSDQVIYLSNLANERPTVRQGPAASENRLYLVWQRGAMREADEQLAARAGVSLKGKVVAHFCSSDLEGQLVRLEETFAKQVGNQKIRKTTFGMRATGQEGFRLSVVEQLADGD